LHIDNDFVMRAALTLADLPVLFKVGTFTTKNVKRVIENWDKICKSLIGTAELLKDLGLLNNKFELVSKNAIIPIAYYISKNGDCKLIATKKNIRKYFVVSQVKGIFGSQGDAVLSKIREALRQEVVKGEEYSLKNLKFDYDDLLNISFSGDKSFKLGKEFIEELMEIEYGSQAYFLLTLLYPNIDYEKNLLDMDHIHPISKFKKGPLKDIGVEGDKLIEEWYELGNCLPNLQLLTSKVNNNKRAKSLVDYLNQIEAEQKGNKSVFIKDNFLPHTDYSFKNFKLFFQKREKDMINKLNLIFH